MPPILDLIGKNFERLTVLDFAFIKNGKSLWKCQCSCGNIITVRGSDLLSGKIKSCGCFKREKLSKLWTKDLIGKRFGRLIVIEKAESTKDFRTRWKCLCDCGNEKIIPAKDLQNGKIKSCGCYQRECITGEKNGNWNGGSSFSPYCPKFNEDFKKRVRSFFNNECVICGKNKIGNNNKNLSVHHVEYQKSACCNNKPAYFAALCSDCHRKTNHNRPKWEYIFHIIIDYLYDGKSYYTKEEYKNLK